MKPHDYVKMRILPIVLVMTLVSLYQLYWLIGQYDEISVRLSEDIQEALRSSDFEELAHRVDEISRRQFQGQVDVSLGYDHKQNKSIVKSDVAQASPDSEEQKVRSSSNMRVSPTSFGSVLKNPEDLLKIGLNMQMGIHSAIDEIKEVNMDYLDDVLTSKLVNLGLSGDHRLLYLRSREEGGGMSGKVDTLGITGSCKFRPDGTFRLKISDSSEYVMTIPQWRLTVLREMTPVILFSVVTFLLLILTFRYLVITMRKQRLYDEMKTDFANNITHELKTPIAVAYAANDSLLNFDAGANTPRMNRFLKVCQEQLILLDHLVEQILSMSMKREKNQVFNIEKIPVGELLDSIVSFFVIKNNDVRFSVDVADNMNIMSDRMHLSNIISNLIDNAIKYSPASPSVSIKAYRDAKGRDVIDVTDNGIGISSEQRKYIFDKFYRVPHGNIHDVKGYGLGLYYVRNMTERLGGTVSVKSEPGKGSSFILCF